MIEKNNQGWLLQNTSFAQTDLKKRRVINLTQYFSGYILPKTKLSNFALLIK